jgi:outer membrane protein insertion porin family
MCPSVWARCLSQPIVGEIVCEMGRRDDGVGEQRGLKRVRFWEKRPPRRWVDGIRGAGLLVAMGTLPCVWSVGAAWGQGAGSISSPASVPSNAPQGTAPGATSTPESQVVPQASQGVTTPGAASASESIGPVQPALKENIWQLQGLRVDGIQFEGVKLDPGDKLPMELEQQAGEPLDPQKVRASERRLYASGRYRDISVRAVRHGQAVTLIFTGPPRFYVGRVQILGIKDERLTSLAEYGTQLQPGTAFTAAAVPAGAKGIEQTLASNGYYQSKVSVDTTADPAGQQMNVTYLVQLGPQARIGNVTVEGTDVGLTQQEFIKKAKLKKGRKVSRETTSNALDKLRALYQKKDRLEATVSLQKSTYDAARKQLDYDFHANEGPIVKVTTEGVKFSKSRLHLLVPVFEESAVDNDLLNEGTHNIKEYLQQEGYFDAAVTVRLVGAGTAQETIVYSVDKGRPHKVVNVTISGNKYFSTELLKESLRVQKADAYLRSGKYSAALVKADEGSIAAIYRANGFSEVKVTSSVKDTDPPEGAKANAKALISVAFKVDEGTQQKFGPVVLAGVEPSREQDVRGLLNAQAGQPFSLITLSGDRDAVLGYYVSHGFDQAKVEIKQVPEKADPSRTDVTLNVTEGQQVFVNKVLESGIVKTKPSVVNEQILMHPGAPLDQSALLETQRNLYNLALFNEVIAAVQNPAGQAPTKNVLVQVTEAKRWDVTYGFGFEAQTGQPAQGQISAASKIQLGLSPTATVSQEGTTGVSPRVSLDVSRINLFGKDESLTLHTTYGLLEKVATLSFQDPHLRNTKNFAASVSGGYSNVQNISTFKASTLQGDLRVTEKFRRTDTFIYDFEYRRVAVDPNSLEVSANLIPLLSEPVRVGGPGITWFHDKRQPTPLDAVKGSYTSVQAFLATSKFGSQTSFNRTDVTNSTYYQFGKNPQRKYTFARNTRVGFEHAFGANPNAGNQECLGVLLTTNASCNAVPLPERLYAGGATSDRGFPLNGAGPRDLQTGFPVGGSAVFVNSLELRMPAPTLPYVGDSVSFVLFHDMGNVFQNVKDMFPSFGRFSQPDKDTCNNVSGSIGTCNFNYFSHAIGLGARYKTPVGPIRADFSYNLNPPIYPVIYDFNNNPPHVGEAGHFNFFFSIGQSF